VEATEAHGYATWPDGATLYENLGKVFYHQEEPFGTASILAQWEVMKLARREQVTVLLDGQGADEILGGYLHYFRPLFMELFCQDKKRLASEIKAYEELHDEKFETDARFKLEARYPQALRLVGKFRRWLTQPRYLEHLNPEFVSNYKMEPPPFKTFSNLNEALKFATQDYGLEKLLRFSDRN